MEFVDENGDFVWDYGRLDFDTKANDPDWGDSLHQTAGQQLREYFEGLYFK